MFTSVYVHWKFEVYHMPMLYYKSSLGVFGPKPFHRFIILIFVLHFIEWQMWMTEFKDNSSSEFPLKELGKHNLVHLSQYQHRLNSVQFNLGLSKAALFQHSSHRRVFG